MESATLWERTLAIIPDLVIVGILQGLIVAVFGSDRVTYGIADPATNGGFTSFTATTTVDAFWLWLAAIAYFTLLEGLFGATVGKAARRLRVTDRSGRRASWQALLLRNVLRVVDWLPSLYLLGVLVARFSRQRQRIGDHLAGTIVVPARFAVGPALGTEQRRQRIGILLTVIAIFIVGCIAFEYYGRPGIVLGNQAALGQFPGGRVNNYSAGPAERNGGTVVFPVSYTLASGKHCTGHITVSWEGLPSGWQVTSAQSSC